MKLQNLQLGGDSISGTFQTGEEVRGTQSDDLCFL